MRHLSNKVSTINCVANGIEVFTRGEFFALGVLYSLMSLFCPVKRVYSEVVAGWGGALVFQTGYHPRKRTFKTHPKHVFFRYENRP